MRILIIIALMVSISLSAQKKNSSEFIKEGKFTKVITYHENGQIAQTGFLKKNRLHGRWISFDKNGKKLAMDSYNSGKKNGQWFFWRGDNLIELVYKNNTIIDKVEWGNKNKVVLNNL